jgi:crotonobetainyl-CoA:carnitine CoA-transferase CaiB-like acyl-CoA transferase
MEDPRFATQKDRWNHHYEVISVLQEEFRKKPRSYWLKALDAKGVPNGSLYAMDELFQDPQVRHLGMLREIHHVIMGSSRLIGSAVDLSNTPPQFIRPAPLLGEDSEGILTQLGYDKEAIQGLRERGVT